MATGIGRADEVVEMGGTRKTANRGKERAASTKRKTPAVVVDDDDVMMRVTVFGPDKAPFGNERRECGR